MYKIRFYCPDCNGYQYLDQEILNDSVNCPIHPSAIIRDFIVMRCDISGCSCRIENTSSVSGDTISDALETLDINKVTFNCPAITIANDENIQIYRFTTNENAKIKVFAAGISNLEGGLPASSYIQIYNETDGQVEYQVNSRFVSGNPIAELNLSQKSITIRATNGTGGAIDMHAFIVITQE